MTYVEFANGAQTATDALVAIAWDFFNAHVEWFLWPVVVVLFWSAVEMEPKRAPRRQLTAADREYGWLMVRRCAIGAGIWAAFMVGLACFINTR